MSQIKWNYRIRFFQMRNNFSDFSVFKYFINVCYIHKQLSKTIKIND